jgi:hypothetical protein
VADASLSPWRHGAEEVCAGAKVVRVLRHLPGRRVATLVDLPEGSAVLKVFASPRARGNVRRLTALRATPAGHVVPAGGLCDLAGHVSVVEWIPGTVFADLDDDRFVRASTAVGAALRALHACGASLDREWTVTNEVEHLERRATRATAHVVRTVAQEAATMKPARCVPAHRDCHPDQIVTGWSGTRWIDLDDAAMAPAALDVGNFVAHIRRDAAIGRRNQVASTEAIRRFTEGYGSLPPDVTTWERLSLARLAGLAETRHGRLDWQAAIVGLLAAPVACPAPAGRQDASSRQDGV